MSVRVGLLGSFVRSCLEWDLATLAKGIDKALVLSRCVQKPVAIARGSGLLPLSDQLRLDEITAIQSGGPVQRIASETDSYLNSDECAPLAFLRC